MTGGLERAGRRALLACVRAALWARAARFRAAVDAPERAQAAVRARLAAQLAATAYGRSLGVRGPRDFDARVPVTDYDALAPWIDRQRAGEPGVITADRVVCYEKTSGSSGAAKYVPYTEALRRSFSRMFAVWAHDLLAHGPGLRTGRLYLSVSPGFAHEPAAGGVPVGLTDDRDYLDGWLRRLSAPFVVGDPSLARAPDAATFKRRTIAALLAAHDLEIVSVWNPSLFKLLLDEIARERVALAPALSGARRRALLVDPIDWRGVWPELRLISCWAAAGAAPQAAALGRILPGIMIQGKGLLATEAPITVPLVGAAGDVPLVDEVLIELEDAAGALVPLCASEEGRDYGLVVSQAGGLTRYRLGDRVRVGPRHRRTPTLALLGRTAAGVSDLCGEKLSEPFVADVLGTLALGAFVQTLVPVREPYDHYVLVVDRLDRMERSHGGAASRRRDPIDASLSEALATALDAGLRRAHHYDHARALGQLGPARVCVAADAAELVLGDDTVRGLALGDIKPRALRTAVPTGALAARLRASVSYVPRSHP